jgi:hypothetical protein
MYCVFVKPSFSGIFGIYGAYDAADTATRGSKSGAPRWDDTMIDWADRASVSPLTCRLDDIRQRLTEAGPKAR